MKNVHFVTFASFCAIVYIVSYIILNHNLNLQSKTPLSASKTKYILYWTTMFSSKKFYFSTDGFELFQNCEVKNCFATNDKTLLPLEEYAALIFHIPRGPNYTHDVLPPRRSHHQRYVFANQESPLRFKEGNTQYVFNGFFNWTMTYRLDSDIPRRYGYIEKRSQVHYVMPTKEFVKNKTRSIAWFASNCRSVNRRNELVKEISRLIDVDVYGKCGNLTCSKNEDCYKTVDAKYRFYLSFENSYCADYVTEKLFFPLTKNIIPIVYGGGNYSLRVPPRSVINVEEFDSVEHLVEYLRYLEADIDSYLEYFKWKQEYVACLSDNNAMCRLCKMLNDVEEPSKVYTNIEKWWWFNNTEKSMCRSENELPQIVPR